MGVKGVEFEVGQTWRTRDGSYALVTAIEIGSYPISASIGGAIHTFRRDGQWRLDPTDLDLVEFVAAPAGDSTQATTFGSLEGIEVTEFAPAIDPSRTNPKDAIGDKKAAMHLLSPIAELHWMIGQYAGMLKYGAWNWRAAGVRSSVYISAARRHLMAYQSGEEYDPVDGSHHLGNVMACCAILLEAAAIGKLQDDRPPRFSHRPTLQWAEDRMAQLKVQYADKAPRHYSIADSVEVGGHPATPMFERQGADDSEGGAA